MEEASFFLWVRWKREKMWEDNRKVCHCAGGRTIIKGKVSLSRLGFILAFSKFANCKLFSFPLMLSFFTSCVKTLSISLFSRLSLNYSNYLNIFSLFFSLYSSFLLSTFKFISQLRSYDLGKVIQIVFFALLILTNFFNIIKYAWFFFTIVCFFWRKNIEIRNQICFFFFISLESNKADLSRFVLCVSFFCTFMKNHHHRMETDVRAQLLD